MASVGNYDEAISCMMAVPNVCADCYDKCQVAATSFYKEVASKLKADDLREWNFHQKQYEDSQAYKRSIVKACRDVGVAWANNQPQSIVKNIIRGWW